MLSVGWVVDRDGDGDRKMQRMINVTERSMRIGFRTCLAVKLLSHHKIDYVPDNVATHMAVGDAFRWAATEIEVSNRSIYTHPWVGADDILWVNSDLLDSTPALSEDVIQGVQK